MANELKGVAASGTLYARIVNAAGQWWNGTTFETYAAANYANYDIALTEQGNSGVYVADFPSGITSGGTYEYFVHRQTGGSPAEGDPVVNTGKVDWTGTAAATGASGSMTASDFRAYLLRLGFKRTDKDTEIYEAITDAIQEMRRRYGFDEAETEATTTDTISTLGDFKISLESDFGMLVGLIMEDDTNARTLTQISRKKFMELYPDQDVTANKGYPEHFCVYAGQIYIGPIPDSTDYSYRKNYSKRGGTVDSTTAAVPFTAAYRDVLALNVLARLYEGLEEFEKAGYYGNKFEAAFEKATHRELVNSGEHCFTQKPTNY